MDFQNVKSYLSKQTENGSSVYEHLSAIVRKLVEEKPQNAMDIFENLSLAVKKSKISSENHNLNVIDVDENERNQIQESIKQILLLYGKKPEKKQKLGNENEEDNDAAADEEEEEEEEEKEPIELSKCANILQHQQLLEWSGISLSSEELFQLQNSFCLLVRQFPVIETSRFWGKIHAIDGDYWIVECKLSEYPEIEEEKAEAQHPRMEEAGKGVNEYTYFVTNSIENSNQNNNNQIWTQLPDINPDHIRKSREICRLFTGDLKAKINGRVYFEWSEQFLLRAQIARISSSTIVAPNEYYTKPEEEDEENPFVVEANEEFQPLEDSVSNESWVHSRAHLRLEGRHFKFVEPEPEEDEDEDAEKEETEPTAEQLEEEIPILQSIANDKCNEYKIDEESEASNVWYTRQLNENIGYKVSVLCNKLWNGSKTIYLNDSKTFVNIYIGNGMKYRSEFYTPKVPHAIQSQFNEWKEIEAAEDEEEEEPAAADDDEENANAENAEQKKKVPQKESVFQVQSEQLPPPPKEENENADENQEDAEEEES